MKARLSRPAAIVVGLLILLITAGVWRVVETVPTLPSTPMAPVLAVPDHDPVTGIRAPYDGPHPRLTERPPETFRFPIRPGEVGPSRPLFAGPRQYPFYCGRDMSRPDHAQPMVDNQEGHGVPVHALTPATATGTGRPERDTSRITGYSKDCQYPTQVRYYYRQEGTGRFLPLEQADGDIEQIEVRGERTDYVVRYETGTINRFFYAIAALRGDGGDGDESGEPSTRHWNGRLIYQFRGGVGIGWRQGDLAPRYVLGERHRELARGYAVVHSTGNQSRNHFNIGLAEDTARRVKRQFTALYGKPVYTVGVGPSGGAIQQYLLAQNAPGLLDGAIALYAYPDMVTQTIHVQDCELLEHFAEETDRDNPLWDSWDNRSLIQGFNASDEAGNRYAPARRAADLLTGRWSRLEGLSGSSECVSGWRGLTPLVSNPRFVDNSPDYADEVRNRVNWTHWDSVPEVYGRDLHGHALRIWDNVGVQYGLASLASGELPVETFLKLNRTVGGWKPPQEMAPEKFWFLNGGIWPVELSFRSEHNMTRSPAPGLPAPRTAGDAAAMRAAWLSGEVFTGVIDIPVIDARHYLEPELDMHHVLASFTTRSRIQRAMGDSDNQVIWVADPAFDPQPMAFDVMDEWLSGPGDKGPKAERGTRTRPAGAVDQCFDAGGDVIAQGEGVWDGSWNDAGAEGECLSRYPFHRTSRQLAGDGMEAAVFRCHRQNIDEAIAAGVYGEADMQPYLDELRQIFPSGVCDYRQGDAAKPEGLLSRLRDPDGTVSGREEEALDE